MSFWQSSVGLITGTVEDANREMFEPIPNNSFLVGNIKSINFDDAFGADKVLIVWEIITPPFTNRNIFQNLMVFSEYETTKHKALNMLMLLYKAKSLSVPQAMPTPDDLNLLLGLKMGLKITETKPNDDGKVYNRIAELYPVAGFETKTGVLLATSSKVDSAFSRNQAVTIPDDDVSF